MKKRLPILLIGSAAFVIIFIAMFFIHAKADVVWEPQNSFYQSHSGSCEQVERSYIANGYNGEVIVYSSPSTNKVLAKVQNGESLNVSYKYYGTNYEWAYIERYDGWVPMDYLAEKYDNKIFLQEHREEIKEESVTLDVSGIAEGDEMQFYTFPGSETADSFPIYLDEIPSFNSVYTDPTGHKWGYISYYFLNKGWICIDNPCASYEELYPEGQSFSGVLEIPEPPTKAIVPSGLNIIAVVGIIIGAIVLITGAVLAIVLVNVRKKKA